MAITTAATDAFRPMTSNTPPLRRLWQVPTFLLGVAALATVCTLHPPWKFPATKPHDPTVAELRKLLQQADFDGDRALKLGAEAVQHADRPAKRAEAHYLLGSAYVILAERAESPSAREQWQQARNHLEQAQALGVAEEDRPKLDYRLAKTWAQTGKPTDEVITKLTESIDAGADDHMDAVRGYGLLAEAYLKLATPDDLKKSLDATDEQIKQPVVDDRLLGAARLRRGELLFRLKRPEEAEEVLRNVGAKAPPDVVSRARRLRVRILEQMERWTDAAVVWQDILDDRQAPPQDRAAVLYHYGWCLRGSDRKSEALSAWNDCLHLDGPREEGTAAALGVADLLLHEGQVDAALPALERAVRDVKQPDDWNNSFIALPRAREVFEAGCKAASASGTFASALRLLELYERLAVPGRSYELRAEIDDAAARAAQEKARLASGAEARKLYGDAQEYLRQAGASYVKAADAQKDPAAQAECLWLAGNRFLDAHDAESAAAAFDRFCLIAEQPEMIAAQRFNARLTEAYYKRGLAWRDQIGKHPKALENATAAFRAANIQTLWKSRYSHRARYELALLEKQAHGHWTDDAQGWLEQTLTNLRPAEEDRDDEAKEKTLYALGDLYYQRRVPREVGVRAIETLSRAIETLEDALRSFPDNPEALNARYELAECYRLRADQRNNNLLQEKVTITTRLEIEKNVGEDRERAISSYQELIRVLDARPNREEADNRLLVYALWEAADVRYWAGGYEKSAEMFEALIVRLRDKKGFEGDYFGAHVNAVRGYLDAISTFPTTDSDYESRVRLARQKVRRLLPEIRAGLPKLDPATRKPFEEWLKAFDKP